MIKGTKLRLELKLFRGLFSTTNIIWTIPYGVYLFARLLLMKNKIKRSYSNVIYICSLYGNDLE